MGGSKNFIPPKIVSVCGGGLKTETGKLHEILTSVCGGGLKPFLFLPHSFGLPIIMPTACLFRAPLVAKIGKRSNGRLHWDAVEAWCNNFDQM